MLCVFRGCVCVSACVCVCGCVYVRAIVCIVGFMCASVFLSGYVDVLPHASVSVRGYVLLCACVYARCISGPSCALQYDLVIYNSCTGTINAIRTATPNY